MIPAEGSVPLGGPYGIYVMDADGSGGHLVAPGGTAPTWSPDGRMLAFARGGGVWVMHANGSGAHEIVHRADGPAWQP